MITTIVKLNTNIEKIPYRDPKVNKITFMMLIFNRTGLERVGVVGPDLDLRRAGLQAPRSSGLR